VNLPLGPKSAPHSGGPADEAYILGRAGTYPKASADCQVFLSEFLNVAFRGFSRTSHAASIADRHYPIRKFTGLKSSPKETIMKEWLKPEITESEAGMEVTSYLPAELDRA
jgi:coenzyme PQQ precursor peptide PqqA